MARPRRGILWRATNLAYSEKAEKALFGMVVAVKLLSAIKKLGANPYIAVAVNTHKQKLSGDNHRYV